MKRDGKKLKLVQGDLEHWISHGIKYGAKFMFLVLDDLGICPLFIYENKTLINELYCYNNCDMFLGLETNLINKLVGVIKINCQNDWATFDNIFNDVGVNSIEN